MTRGELRGFWLDYRDHIWAALAFAAFAAALLLV